MGKTKAVWRHEHQTLNGTCLPIWSHRSLYIRLSWKLYILKGNASKWHKKDLDTHLSGRVRMQHMQRSGFYYQHYKITKWKYKAGLPNTILIIYCFLTLLMIPCFVVPGYYMIVGHMSSAFDSHNYHRTVNNLKIR